MKKVLLALVACLLLAAYAEHDLFAGNMPMAPDFTLQDMNGRNVSLKDYKGKNVLLYFTTTWCPYCKREVPQLKELQTKYRGRLEIIAVDMNESRAKVESYNKKYQVTYTTLLDTEAKVAIEYGIRGVPTKILIDREGRVFCYMCNNLSVQIEDLINKPLARPDKNQEKAKPQNK